MDGEGVPGFVDVGLWSGCCCSWVYVMMMKTEKGKESVVFACWGLSVCPLCMYYE